MLFYLMGKSASGKDALFRSLAGDPELKLKPLIIYTTRPIRSGEQDGVEYYFTDEKRLQELLDAGKVIEMRVYQTIHGPWTYYTVNDHQFGRDMDRRDLLGIGTLESYRKLKEALGENMIAPIYVEVEDGLRLQRALAREMTQEVPRYEEMCRRFLSDQRDFAPEKITEAGITKKFFNNTEIEKCLDQIRAYIKACRQWNEPGSARESGPR